LPDNIIWFIIVLAFIFAFLLAYGILWNLIGMWLMGRKIRKQGLTTKDLDSSDATENKPSNVSH
jgi:uncharacterized protein HemY